MRECFEESGVEVKIIGIINATQSLKTNGKPHLKVIFYAEPIDEDVIPNKKKTKHSKEAKWIELHELHTLK